MFYLFFSCKGGWRPGFTRDKNILYTHKCLAVVAGLHLLDLVTCTHLPTVTQIHTQSEKCDGNHTGFPYGTWHWRGRHMTPFRTPLFRTAFLLTSWLTQTRTAFISMNPIAWTEYILQIHHSKGVCHVVKQEGKSLQVCSPYHWIQRLILPGDLAWFRPFVK